MRRWKDKPETDLQEIRLENLGSGQYLLVGSWEIFLKLSVPLYAVNISTKFGSYLNKD
jgi:hypothetical protein